ncbi:hypothetical protein SOVF_134580, partial [Spinacia oleracea]
MRREKAAGRRGSRAARYASMGTARSCSQGVGSRYVAGQAEGADVQAEVNVETAVTAESSARNEAQGDGMQEARCEALLGRSGALSEALQGRSEAMQEAQGEARPVVPSHLAPQQLTASVEGEATASVTAVPTGQYQQVISGNVQQHIG